MYEDDEFEIEVTLEEIFGTGIQSVEQTVTSDAPGGINEFTVTLTNGKQSVFRVRNGDSGGSPVPVASAADMTDEGKTYLYLGSEDGYAFAHWYYYDGEWKDSGVYGQGAAGFSPTATVEKNGSTTTITITDQNGTTTANVEDGTESHTKVVFMPVAYYENDNSSGDCTVIKTGRSGKVIMYDTGASHSYDLIKGELRDLGITHVDYFILTHYHADHYWNLESLMNDNYIDSDTVVYLPKSAGVQVSNWGNESWVRSTVAGLQTIEPNSNTVLDVDDVHITFFNCDDADIAYYDQTTTLLNGPDCNNYSICSYVTIGETTILMAGDIQPAAEQYLYDNGYIHKCDILKIPHHSYDNAASMDFYLTVNPTYSVAFLNAYMEQKLMPSFNSRRTAYLSALGSKVYITGHGAVRVGVGQDLYTLYPNSSSDLRYKFKHQTVTLFVDSTYRGSLSNGSYEYPFKTVHEALAFASGLTIFYVQIMFLNDYTDSLGIALELSNAIPMIGIDGTGYNVTLPQIRVHKSYLELLNLTVDTTATISINASEHSCLRLVNVNITTNKRSAATVANGRGINANMYSKVWLENCTLSNLRAVFGCNAGGEVIGTGVLGQNNEYLFTASNGKGVTLRDSSIAFDNLVNEASASIDMANVNDSRQYSSTGGYLLFKADAGNTQTTYTIDLTSSVYRRKTMILTDSAGMVKVINRWANSMAVLDVVTPASPVTTVAVNGYTLSVTTTELISIYVMN